MTAAATEAPLDLRAAWRQMRLPLVVGALVIGVAAALAAIETAPAGRPLDPGDASPVGGRALTQLLRDRGVTVRAVGPGAATAAAAGDTTVFVPDPASMTVDALRRLAASAAQVVVVDPSARELAALDVPAQQTGVVDMQTLDPGCGYQPAAVAGPVRIAGDLYHGEPGDIGCYSLAGSAALLVHPRPGGGVTTVLGSGPTLGNDHLAEEGDAALGLGLLSSRPRVVWVVPQPPTSPPADARRRSVAELLPHRLLWAAVQLLVAVVAVGLWRGRRLGPVVAEPMPVVVRAAETVRGRARLMRAARLRGRAAQALRAAARARLGDSLGLGAAPPRGAVVESVAHRTGRIPAEVDAVLFGPDPPDDAAMVRLAEDLDALERSVRRT